MVSEEDVQHIKTATEEFLRRMGASSFAVEAACAGANPDSPIAINVQLPEPQFFIGKNGQTLVDIQRLLRIILQKKLQKSLHLLLDFNNYQQEKVEYLKKTAREAADQAALTGQKKVLPPMSSYERRIIHAELAGRSDVATQSQGEGPERSVVIKPATL